jgi:hypothetical protein
MVRLSVAKARKLIFAALAGTGTLARNATYLTEATLGFYTNVLGGTGQ